MFPHLTGFNLKNWIDENRGDWGRRRIIWEDSDFIIFVTRGPNTRTDFHINPGDEVRVDPLAGTVENLTAGETLEAEPLPEHLLTMIADGGLLAHLEKKLTPGK